MRAFTTRGLRFRGAVLLAGGLLLVPVLSATAFPVQGGQADLSAIRNATAKYHDVNAAIADGYGPFYICTDKEGTGAMGQPELSTSAKVEQLLSVASDAIVDFLTEFRAWKPGKSLRGG